MCTVSIHRWEVKFAGTYSHHLPKCVAVCCNIHTHIFYLQIRPPTNPTTHTPGTYSNTHKTLQHTATHCNTLQHTLNMYRKYALLGWREVEFAHASSAEARKYLARPFRGHALARTRTTTGYSLLLQCVTVCCRVLQCDAVCCSVLQCVAVCCSLVQCVSVCCSVLQCVAVCCSLLQVRCTSTYAYHHRIFTPVAVCCSVLQRVTVCCSVLQCVAVCCSVLQLVAVCCSVLQCVAVCCSVLQR